MAKQRKNKNVRNKTIKDGVQKEETQSSLKVGTTEETAKDASQPVASIKPEEKIESKPADTSPKVEEKPIAPPKVEEKPTIPPPKMEEKKPEPIKEEPKLELKPADTSPKVEEKPIAPPKVEEKPTIPPPKMEEKKPEPIKEEPKLELKPEPVKPEEKKPEVTKEEPKLESKPAPAAPKVEEKPVAPPKVEEKKPEPIKEEPKLELKPEPVKPEAKPKEATTSAASIKPEEKKPEVIKEEPKLGSKPVTPVAPKVEEKPVAPPKVEEKKPEPFKKEPVPVNREKTSSKSYLMYGIAIIVLFILLVWGIKSFLPHKEPSPPPAIAEDTVQPPPPAVEKVVPDFSAISEKFLKTRNAFYEAEIEPSLAQSVNKDSVSLAEEISSFSNEKLGIKEQVEKSYYLMNLYYYASATSSDDSAKIESADKSLKSAEEISVLLKSIDEKAKEVIKQEKTAKKEKKETSDVDEKEVAENEKLLETQKWIKEENIQEKVSFYTALNLSLKKISGADVARKDIIDILKTIPRKFMKNGNGGNLYNHPTILQAVKKDKKTKKTTKKDK